MALDPKPEMHELLSRVLREKSLSKAGELFGVSEWDMVGLAGAGLPELVALFSSRDYADDPNAQSVVEIVLARLTSAIRETQTMETWAPGLVDCLTACLAFPLHSHSPHSRIAADLLSALFLHYNSPEVMALVIPAGVSVLDSSSASAELVRNTTSFLSLAAIHQPALLSPQAPALVAVLLRRQRTGLLRLLPPLYPDNPSVVLGRLDELLGLLPTTEAPDSLALLQLCVCVGDDAPAALRPHLGLFSAALTQPAAAPTMLHLFLTLLGKGEAAALAKQLTALRSVWPTMSKDHLPTLGKIVAKIGRLHPESASDAASLLAVQCGSADWDLLPQLLAELEGLAESYPESVRPLLPQLSAFVSSSPAAPAAQARILRLTEICRSVETPCRPSSSVGSSKEAVTPSLRTPSSNLSRPKSRSYSNLITSRKATAEAGLSSPFQPYRKPAQREDFTRLLVSTPDNRKEATRQRIFDGIKIRRSSKDGLSNRNSMFILTPTGDCQEVQLINSKGRVRLTSSPFRPLQPIFTPPLENDGSPLLKSYSVLKSSGELSKVTQSHVVTTFNPNMSITQRTGSGSTLTVQDRPSLHPNPPSSSNSRNTSTLGSLSALIPLEEYRKPRKRDATTQSTATLDQLQACPYDGSDAVGRFSWKHMGKMGPYMAELGGVVPVPARVTIEGRARRSNRMRVHLACQAQGPHCLHPPADLFTLTTRLPHLWLHLMYLHLQAKTVRVLGLADANVAELESCWEALPNSMTKALPLSTILTSKFPEMKDQRALRKELEFSGYFDAFCFNQSLGKWACFACNDPNKVESVLGGGSVARAFLSGELKEKRGRWKFLKRWQTRYFTLSARALSTEEALGRRGDLDLRSIRSVKSVKRSSTYTSCHVQMMNQEWKLRRKSRPRAFEIFTESSDGRPSFVLKAADGTKAQEWLTCLQIAVAQAHKSPDVIVSSF